MKPSRFHAQLVHLTRAAMTASLAWTSMGCPDPDSKVDGSPDAAHMLNDAAPPDAATHSKSDASKPDAATPSDAGTPHDPPNDASMPQDAAAPHDAGDIDATPSDPDPNDAAVVDSGSVDEDSGAEHDAGPPPDEDHFTLRVVTLGLEAPWEIAWGPDDRLWITERVGKRVIRVDPADGATTVALTVTDAYQSAGQDGVLGMALDPRLGHASGGDYVYLAYTYDADSGSSVDRRAQIVRYTYDANSGTLGTPVPLISGLPASNDHNSGRLVYGPDGRLYYTIGDQGKNQFDNMCQTIRAQDLPTQPEIDQQDWSAYQGKTLRLELNGSIPLDNPMIAGVRSHIYSYGHRNSQGIAFGPDGKLYADEQGPKTDDEVNLILPGKNYGWPQVAGYQDDKAYVYGNWSASSPEPCANLIYSDYGWPFSVPEERESDWSNADFVAPLMTFYTVDDSYNFMDPACAGNEFICWPTIAPSSLDVYVASTDGLQTWGTSLLLTSLKQGSVIRVHLTANGQATVGAPTELFKTTNRYRDLAIAPDKRTFYVITDSDGSTSGPTSGSTQMLDHPGAILEFSSAP
jgi:PQQ-dependent dehydrogenase (s-GDH family)